MQQILPQNHQHRNTTLISCITYFFFDKFLPLQFIIENFHNNVRKQEQRSPTL
jgi:hypothetical protein